MSETADERVAPLAWLRAQVRPEKAQEDKPNEAAVEVEIVLASHEDFPVWFEVALVTKRTVRIGHGEHGTEGRLLACGSGESLEHAVDDLTRQMARQAENARES